MMNLKLVKDKSADNAYIATNGCVPSGYVNHGTKVLKELVYPWVGKRDRVVAWT